MNLKTETIEAIEQIIPRYPEKRSAMMMVLLAILEDQGFISDEALEWVAQKLEVAPVEVEGIITFYPMFRRKPLARHHVKVCRTLSCAMRGSHAVHDVLKEKLGCQCGQSADGEFEVEYVECMAACGSAPVVMVNDELYENITPENAEAFAEKLKAQAKQ